MPDWRRIAEQQERGRRSMYSAEVLEEMDRTSRASVEKNKLLDLLRSDPEFRKEVKKILNEDK